MNNFICGYALVNKGKHCIDLKTGICDSCNKVITAQFNRGGSDVAN